MPWRWPWRRRRTEPVRLPYSRIPDYDTVIPPGHPLYRPSWADLCSRPSPFGEPTQVLPTVPGPLRTRGAHWRAGGGKP